MTCFIGSAKYPLCYSTRSKNSEISTVRLVNPFNYSLLNPKKDKPTNPTATALNLNRERSRLSLIVSI